MKNTFTKVALLAQRGYSQTHYLWTNNVAGAASGGWDNAANWSPNGLPTAGDTADFSTLAITNVSTISLDGDQTNANLVFGDIFPQGTWLVDASGTLTLATASGTPTISVTNQTATIQATILGTQGFTKLGAGTLLLSGVNTYSGITTNSAGTLTIGAAGSGTGDAPSAGPVGVGPLVLAGGTLNVAAGGGIIYNSIVVPTGGTVAMGTTASGVQLALGGSISGGGTINESGNQTAGTHLSGTNSAFTGTFNSTGNGSHRMRFDNANSGSAAAVWNLNNNNTDGYGYAFGGGTIYFGALQGGGNMRSDAGGNTVTILQIGDLNIDSTWSGTINANGTQFIAINKTGTGKFTLSANNGYNGYTTISGGVFQLGSAGSAGMFGSSLVTNNSKLAFSYNRSDTFGFPATLITGTGSFWFTNTGAGIMTLNCVNNETGDTTIAAGMIRLLNPASIPGGPGAGNLVLNGTLDVNSNSLAINGLSGGGVVDNLNTNGGVLVLTIGSNNVSSVFNGAIKNSAAPTNGSALAVVKTGTGTISISGANTYNGNTVVNGGELDINTSKTGGGAIIVSAGTTLGVLVSSPASIPAATLTASNTSVLSFSGLTSTTVAPITATNLAPNGTITINVAGSFVAGSQYPLIKFGGYTGTGGFALGTVPVGTTATIVTNGGTIALNVTAAAPLVWKGNVSANWDIGTTANWTLNLAAATYVQGQTVQFNDAALTGNVNLSTTVSPGGVLVTNGSLNYVFSSTSGGGISGSGALTKLGGGTLTLSGLTNAYSGATTIGGGTVVIDRDQNIGAATPGNITLNGGSLSAAGTLTLSANRAIAVGPSVGSGGGTIDVASGQTLIFGGVIANNAAGTGTLTKTGNGTLALNGPNTYGGGTLVSGGKLSLTAAQQSGGAITVNDGATLNVSRTGGTTLPSASLTLGSGGATTLQLGNLSTSSAIITATNLTTSGTVTVGILTGVPALGEVPLIKYSGSIAGSGFGAFTLSALPPGVTAALTNDTANKIVGLLVSDVAALTWTGTNGTTWDIGVTTNWQYLGAGVTFSSGSGVILDDTAFTNIPNLNATASMFNMLVTNNTLNYTLNGGGSLSGPMTLTKSGTGTFTMANLANDTYTGGTVLNQGVLDVRSDNALGTGTLTLAGGTVENNSSSLTTLPNGITVQSGTTNIIQITQAADPQLAFAGNIIGGGNIIAQTSAGTSGIRLSGDNSGFTGTLTVVNNSSMRFRFSTANSGSANANWVLDSAGVDNQKFEFGTGTISFGSMAGNGQLRNDGGASTVTLRVGDLNTNTVFSGIIIANGTAQFAVTKAGTGVWTLTGANTYAGATTVSGGVLALSNNVATGADGSIANSPVISVAAGATLDVTGRSDGALTVGGTQTLQGRGAVNGLLNVNGTVAPGDGVSGNTGTLTASNTVNIFGTAWMKLDRSATPNSDRLVSAADINYLGILIVTNVGATLQPGDTFTLFSGTTYNGSVFGSIVLPNYQAFDTSTLNVNGTITYLGVSKPAISSVDFSTLASGFITLNATNGLAGGPVIVLTTTNIALPVSAWTPVTTNAFDGSGNYGDTIPVDPSLPQQFYLLKVQ